MNQAVRTDILTVRGVSKIFGADRGSVAALSDVNFSVRRQQFVTIVGPSGCGKSTLMQILGGLASASCGEVLLNGEKIAAPRPDHIAAVFQEPWLLPWKSAQENVEFPLSLKGVAVAERRARAAAQLELVGLAHAATRLPHELSGGMRQRVAIARALVQEPDLLLMDEPFAALDEQTRTKMGNELLRIWEHSRRTIVFITHGLTEAIYLADVILVMAARPGRIVERIEVPLPRPRSIDMIGSEVFGQLRNRIWQLIGDSP